MPPLRTMGACCWVGVPPPLNLPWRPLALGAGGRLGGPLISVRPPSGSRALRACWEPPSRSWRPPHRGVSRWCSRGSPPDSLLRAMGARCWVGVNPPPSPPRWPLALGAHNRLGGTFSSVSLLAVSLSELALLGVSPPPSSRCFLPLLLVAPWPSSAGAGPALAWPPTDACDTTFLYSRRGCMPFSVVAAAALVECSWGCPALPAPSAVSIAASGVSVVPRRAVPSPPLGGCSLVARAVGRFLSPPPPTPVCPPPIGIRMLWGIPGFCLPWVPHPLWGSSHPVTTRPPLHFLFDSSHPAMTRLPRLLRWGASRPGTI